MNPAHFLPIDRLIKAQYLGGRIIERDAKLLFFLVSAYEQYNTYWIGAFGLFKNFVGEGAMGMFIAEGTGDQDIAEKQFIFVENVLYVLTMFIGIEAIYSWAYESAIKGDKQLETWFSQFGETTENAIKHYDPELWDEEPYNDLQRFANDAAAFFGIAFTELILMSLKAKPWIIADSFGHDIERQWQNNTVNSEDFIINMMAHYQAVIRNVVPIYPNKEMWLILNPFLPACCAFLFANIRLYFTFREVIESRDYGFFDVTEDSPQSRYVEHAFLKDKWDKEALQQLLKEANNPDAKVVEGNSWDRIVSVEFYNMNTGCLTIIEHPEFDMEFSITEITSNSSASSYLKIFNLSSDTRSKIDSDNTTVTITAGYNDSLLYRTIYSGYIESMYDKWSGADKVTRISLINELDHEAQEGLAHYIKIDKGVNGINGIPAMSLIRMFFALANLPVTNDTITYTALSVKVGTIFAGSVTQNLKQLARYLNEQEIKLSNDGNWDSTLWGPAGHWVFYTEDGLGYFTKDGYPRANVEMVYLTPNTGLMSIECNEDPLEGEQYIATTTFNPFIKEHLLVYVNSINEGMTSYYIVDKYTHTLTRNEFKTVITLKVVQSGEEWY